MTADNANPDFVTAYGYLAVRDAVAEKDIAHLVEILGYRDREIENYLNVNVVRRTRAASVRGDATTYHATAWTAVTNGPDVLFPKARPQSSLICRLDVSGVLSLIPAGGAWIEHGVRVLDSGGATVVDTAVVRTPYVLGQLGFGIHHGGAIEVASVPATLCTVRLLVRVSVVNTAEWTPSTNSTLSLTVTETRAA